MRSSRRFLRHGAAVLAAPLLALSVPAARAQSPGPTVLDTVVVTGSTSARRLTEAPYAISVVDDETLRSSGARVNLSEALGRVPGLVVANRSNYAQDLQISSRGFGARAGFGVRGLRLYTDGIPATMPDGQGQVSHFDLAGAQRIEVLRGPFSVLYGNSSGGVIALFTAPPMERRLGLDVDRGSFGMRQSRLSVESPFGEGYDLRASFSAFDIDGFRPHSQARRHLANLRLGWRGERDSLLLLASDLAQDAQDPLGLTRAQFDADSGQTTAEATTFDTRKKARQTQIGARWEHTFAGTGALAESALTAYRGSRGVIQWLAIPAGTQAPAGHGGGVIDFDRRYHGLDGRLIWRWPGLELVTGLAAESASDDRQGYENFTGPAATPVLGVTGALRRDESNQVSTRDAYAQAELQIVQDLGATLGIRHGRVRFEATDRYLANGNDAGAMKLDYTNPVAGLRWRARPGLTLHLSAARGFESPTLNELAYRSDQQAGFNDALRPQTSRQLELGARWTAGGIEADAALFRVDTQDEIVVRTNRGGRATFQNAGRTRRDGAELALQARLGERLRAQFALTWLDARYTDGFLTCPAMPPCLAPTVPVPAGKRVAGTFGRSAYAELAWRPLIGQPATLALEWRAQGRMAVNDANSDFAGGYGTASLRASHQWRFGNGGQRLELLARIDNLIHRRHAGSVIVNEGNGRYFEPAPPRNGLLGLRWSSDW